MPFDPVRDAVLNSPVIHAHPLPASPASYFPQSAYPWPPNTHTGTPGASAPSSSSTPNAPPLTPYGSLPYAPSAAVTAMQSPTSSRRATDLAVLLNADDRVPSPAFTRRTSASDSPGIGTPRPRSSSHHLAHILQPTNSDEPFHPSHPSHQHQQGPPHPPSPSVSPLQKASDILQPSLTRQRAVIPPVADLPPPIFPPESLRRKSSTSTMSAGSVPRSPELQRSRLSESPTVNTRALPQRPPIPVVKDVPRSTVPYAPRQRRSAPGLVLKPLSETERKFFKAVSSRNPLRNRPGKRKLEDISNEKSVLSLPEPPTKRIKDDGDVDLVVDHYNMRPDVGVTQRQQSPIIGLKNFNNWVKSVLIARFAHPVLQGASVTGMNGKQHPGPSGRVLDMGCGKGGDLNKWQKARVRDYVGVDIADVSVKQARSRYLSSSFLKRHNFSAFFAALDCYTHPLSNVPDLPLEKPFDVVSMQFCMHYAFESLQKTRMMLENVTRWLRAGGRFIGTIPNDKLLLSQLDALPSDQDPSDLSFGNKVYRIRFDDRDERPDFGMRYFFFLQDAVEDVPEYVVHWDNFVQLAKDYHLKLLYREEFHHVYSEHVEDPEFGPLLQRMKVVDTNGESQMDEDQWEAANIYIAFAFEKM